MVDIQKCLPVLSLCRGEVSSSRSLPDTSSSATQVAAACLVPTTFPTGKKSALGRPFQKKLIAALTNVRKIGAAAGGTQSDIAKFNSGRRPAR